MPKPIHELRNQARRIINMISEQGLSVEEGIYIIETAKWFLTYKYLEERLGK